MGRVGGRRRRWKGRIVAHGNLVLLVFVALPEGPAERNCTLAKRRREDQQKSLARPDFNLLILLSKLALKTPLEKALKLTPKTAPKSGLPTASVAVFDMGGVLLDWNPRHLYRKLIPDAAGDGAFPGHRDHHASGTWLQDAGGDPAEATRRLKAEHPGQGGPDRSLLRPLRRDAATIPFPRWRTWSSGCTGRERRFTCCPTRPAFSMPGCAGPAQQRHPFLGRFRDYVVSGHGAAAASPTRRSTTWSAGPAAFGRARPC